MYKIPFALMSMQFGKARVNTKVKFSIRLNANVFILKMHIMCVNYYQGDHMLICCVFPSKSVYCDFDHFEIQ